jgi:hypothetical protein
MSASVACPVTHSATGEHPKPISTAQGSLAMTPGPRYSYRIAGAACGL